MANADNDTREVRATARFVRMAPTKVRQVARDLPGRSVEEARRVLMVSSKQAAEQLDKTLASAVANAENNEGLDPDDLVVTSATVDEGPVLRRFRPRAMGRATRIHKRTSHITITVGSRPDASAQRSAAASRRAPEEG